MKVSAQMTATRHELPLGHEFTTFHWQGPALGIATVGCRDWKRHEKQLRAAGLRVIGPESPFTLRMLVSRASGPYWLSWARYCVIERLSNTWASLKARIIVTLEVWGVAHVPVGEMPQWRHVGRTRTNCVSNRYNSKG